MCTLKGKGETQYYLIRKGKNNTRVLEVGQVGEGELIATDQIEREWETPKPENPQAASSAAPTPEVSASTQPPE
jgi:hypothetical protein